MCIKIIIQALFEQNEILLKEEAPASQWITKIHKLEQDVFLIYHYAAAFIVFYNANKQRHFKLLFLE